MRRAKCSGGGLSAPTPDAGLTVRDLEIDAGYAAAVAVAPGMAAVPISVKRFEFARLGAG